MKRLLISCCFIFLFVYSEAQVVSALPAAAAISPDSSKTVRKTTASRFQLKKPEYHVTAGMEFSTTSGYGSGFTQYVVPTVSYPLGKRFLISGGIAVANTSYFNARPFFTGENFTPYNGNYTSLTVFAQGTYFVNDKLTISGAFYKQIPIAGKPLVYSPYYPISQQGAQGLNLNVQYKLGEHVFIQAGFEMNQGMNPYDVNPYAPRHAHGLGDLNFRGLPQSVYNIFSPGF